MTTKKEDKQEENFFDLGSKKKVIYFYEQKIPVHIKLKSGKWLNGRIVLVEVELFMIEDFRRGEVPILFEEIEHIEKYKQLNEVQG